MTRVKSGGDDDVAAFFQVCPQEDAAGVNVNGAGHLLLQGVHPVVPVQLHLGRHHRGMVSRTALGDNVLVSTLGGQMARTDPTVLGELELREPAKWSQLGWMENKHGHGSPNSVGSGTQSLLHPSSTLRAQQATHSDQSSGYQDLEITD